MKPFCIMLLVISFVLGIHAICFAESDHVGIVKTVAGDTVIMRNDKPIRAEVNTKVLKGDLLKTGPDGKVGVIFEDDTVISMGPNSEIVIKNFLFHPAEKKMSFIARIIQGTASFISGQITKLAPDLVHIETPDATIGMRGTQVLVQVE